MIQIKYLGNNKASNKSQIDENSNLMKIDWVANIKMGGRSDGSRIIPRVHKSLSDDDVDMKTYPELDYHNERSSSVLDNVDDDENNLKYYLSHISPSEWLKHKKLQKYKKKKKDRKK